MGDQVKRGLVLEGGAMRGMFTCGVTDVMMEQGIRFDGGIGVSAGAAFGCNYKSGQIGRAIRYNKRFCTNPRFAGWGNLLRTGDLYDVDFCYHRVPEELDPFDHKSYAENPMEFYAVCTDVTTGLPVYHRCDTGIGEDVQWLRASASMPLLSKVVSIGEHQLLDGGIGDSIPLSYFESLGYNRNVVVLTRPEGYEKGKNRFLPLAHIMLRRYPEMIKAMADRHIRYNAELRMIGAKEAAGEIFVIRPPKALIVGGMERDPDKLEGVYQTGRAVAQKRLDELKAFLS